MRRTSENTSIYGILAAVLGVLLLLWLVGNTLSPSTATTVPKKTVPLPPAAQLQQQHPDWPIYYCQQITDGTVSTGMTKEMVLLAWGNPGRQFASEGKEFLSYPYIVTFHSLPWRTCPGIRNVVSLENNTVTGIATMSIYEVDLNHYIGWSKDMILLFFGPPSSVGEHPSGDDWTYKIEGVCTTHSLEEGIKANTVFLYFNPGGQVASWSRYGD